MGRTILALPLPPTQRRSREQGLTVEKTVKVAGALATRFFKDRITVRRTRIPL